MTFQCTSSTFAERVLCALPVALLATDLDGRVAAASGAACQLIGTAACNGALYDQLPLPSGMWKAQMAQPHLLETQSAENVWPVRDENGRIAGAIQVLGPRAPEAAQWCAAIAHEIRNPLMGIQGFADLLHKDLEQHDSRRALAGKIISGVQTLNATVSSMLEFCRPRPPSLVVVQMDALLKSAVELAGCTGGLEVTIDVDRWCAELLCDRLQMLQALVNLIRNAAQATPPGGKIAIAASRTPNAVRISVQDTGTGMDARTRASLFTPFFTTKARGTGVGLAIVKKIIQQHNGEIHIESEHGRGTLITIILPTQQTFAPLDMPDAAGATGNLQL